MKELPILFSAPMVRAILDDSKGMTRRVLKPFRGDDYFVLVQNEVSNQFWPYRSDDGESSFVKRIEKDGHYLDEAPIECPYGNVGDRLWVRETWSPGYDHNPDAENGPEVSIIYKADKSERSVKAPSYEFAERWQSSYSCDGPNDPILKPSIFMPRWASRILLEVVSIKVERLQDISEEDARKEGVIELDCDYCRYTFDENLLPRSSAKAAFESLWDSINAKKGFGWGVNPWVWCIEFRRVKQ